MPAPESAPANPLSALADYLCAVREAITERWIKAVCADALIPTSDNLTFHQLVDHMPVLFDDLATRLREGNITGAVPQATQDAKIHGHHRWQQGYDVTELLRDIAAARRIILLSAFADFAAQHPAFTGDVKAAAKRIIHEFFENLVVNSVAQYVADQQAAMQKINAELQSTNHRLHETNENLQQVNRSRLLLTRNVSHEIRNIANAISGAINVLATEGRGPVHEEMIAICNRSLGDMQALLHQLLDYSALLTRHETVVAESCSLRDLCRDVTATFTPIAQQYDVEFVTECPTDLAISSDYRKLKQIAANLILNAIKYRKPGVAGRVQFSCDPIDGDRWRMMVVDNGIGIAETDLKVVFNEFQRGAAAEHVQGTGLGLTITKRLTELLGGKIEATSALGEGSRFDVTLPRTISSAN